MKPHEIQRNDLTQVSNVKPLNIFETDQDINIDINHIFVIKITVGDPSYSHLNDRSDLIIRFEAFIRSLPTLFLFLRFVYRSWVNFSTEKNIAPEYIVN